MKLERLELEGWRNYDRLSVDFHPQRNVICGENAQGKTNLLEAKRPASPPGPRAGSEHSKSKSS